MPIPIDWIIRLVELGTCSYKPNEGMYTVKGNDSA